MAASKYSVQFGDECDMWRCSDEGLVPVKDDNGYVTQRLCPGHAEAVARGMRERAEAIERFIANLRRQSQISR